MSLMSLTAVELGRKIKEKEVTVEEAVTAALDAIEKREAQVHSFVTVDREGALKRAKEVQAKIDAGELTGPLAGVPVAIKDNMCTKGLLTTCSSKILYNFVPTYTAEAVLNLEKAGAVILGKTNMDEFAMGSTTETSAYGVTKNPWNTGHVPGGSSGGSCAEASSNLARFDGVKYGYRTEQYDGLHNMYKKTRSEGFGAEAKRRIMLGSFVLSSGYYDAYYLKALRTKALIKQAFDKAFEKYDVILGPAAPTTAPKLGASLSDPLKMYLGDIYTISVNLAGLPGITLPCGTDQSGLPIGLQLIGDCFAEKKIIRAAYTYEQTRSYEHSPLAR